MRVSTSATRRGQPVNSGVDGDNWYGARAYDTTFSAYDQVIGCRCSPEQMRPEMLDQELSQGTIITVEFDKGSAPLGLDLTEPGVVSGEIAENLRMLAPCRRLDEDFSASTYAVEFVVIAAANISVQSAMGLIKGLISRRAARRGLIADVYWLPRAPQDSSVRLAVTVDPAD